MTEISKDAVERLADSYVVPHLPPDCRPARTAATLRALRAELDRSEARVATLEGAVPEGWRQDAVVFRNYPFVVMDTPDGWVIQWHHQPAGVSHNMSAVFKTAAGAMEAADMVRKSVDGKTCSSENYAVGTAALADERKEG